MKRRTLTLVPVVALILSAQETIRRPSPFPEKNRERESVRTTRRLRATTPHSATAPTVRAGTSGAEDRPSGASAHGESGRACFFTSKSDGGLTASGERLNASELVAGHASYPLGSRVTVTNVANGRTVTVRIVDRFPDPKRIINLSEAAARELDFIQAGTADVKVEQVREGTASRER